MSEVLTLEQARAANLGGGLSDEGLQAAIDEEEAWLAGRIGPLLGERTERFALAYLQPLGSTVTLRRRTAAVEVEQDGEALTVLELRPDGRRVALLPEGTRYVGVVEVTYEPDDELEVRRALKQLLGLQLGEVEHAGLQAETMGTYSYQKGSAGAAPARSRASIVRSLLATPQAGSMRLRSSVPHGLAGTLDR